MPTYQYACTECDNRFEQVQAFSDASLTECPVCGGKLRKVYGSVGVVFKGSGFYRTDSRSGAASPAASGEKSDGAAATSTADSGKKAAKESVTSASKSGDSGSSSSGSSSSGSSSSSSSGSSSNGSRSSASNKPAAAKSGS